MDLVVGIRLIGPQGRDEVGIDLAALLSLDVVVLVCSIVEPEKQTFLLIEIRRDIVLRAVQIVLVDRVEKVCWYWLPSSRLALLP